MFKFTYTNRGTHAARKRDGKQIFHTNEIRLWRDNDGNLRYDRRYVSSTGKVDDSAIEHTFESKMIGERVIRHSAIEIAQQIHWGCCGWAANTTQIYPMIEKIKPFVEGETD